VASYFISDLHLKSLDEESSRLLLFFFRETWHKSPGDVYLLGDIFDIWVSDHSVFIKRYQPIIDELKKIKSQGYKIVYFEGNHDLHLKKYWQKILGFEVYFDVGYFDIEGKVFRLEHGDLINLADENYQWWRKFLRSPMMVTLGANLPGAFWNFLAEKYSHQSRKMSSAYREQRKAEIIEMIRAHAPRAYQEKSFDYIISGHMHVVDDFETAANNGTKIRSINLGTWLDGAKILKYEADTFTWLKAPNFK
tara:strand:- start:124641 stop:125390 length:750 start_codon:yes stop_codon:yes gene_type:complete